MFRKRAGCRCLSGRGAVRLTAGFEEGRPIAGGFITGGPIRAMLADALCAELTAGKMAVFISHRFSTVRMADRIVVLENGRIAEEGDHEYLTSLGGRYAEMFELQAASYR